MSAILAALKERRSIRGFEVFELKSMFPRLFARPEVLSWGFPVMGWSSVVITLSNFFDYFRRPKVAAAMPFIDALLISFCLKPILVALKLKDACEFISEKLSPCCYICLLSLSSKFSNASASTYL